MSEAPQRIWAWRYASTSKPSAPPYKLARGAWDDRASERHASDVEYIRADAIATHPAVAALVDALKWYANAEIYKEGEAENPWVVVVSSAELDSGNRARAALAALRATKDGA